MNDDNAASNLARNIRQLRDLRGLTQQKLSRLSGVPRPTLATLESGSANPTLQVLVRVSQALQVSIEELIGPPRATGVHYQVDELKTRNRTGVEVRRILPETVPNLEIERMAFSDGARLVGIPHTPGTREYLTCESGRVELTVSGEQFVLSPGDVVVFRGDQKHSYRALGVDTVVFSVVAIAH